MIKKLRKKLVLYSSISIFILLSIVFFIVNVTNFTMVANDADRLTKEIAQHQGSFDNGLKPQGPNNEASPEMRESARYFTIVFDVDMNPSVVVFKISTNTMKETEAIKMAESLLNYEVGWTDTVYRYRVYKIEDKTYVTVMDFGRELRPSYNVLWISLASLIIGTFVSVLILVFVSKYFVGPLEESDKRQKRFIKDATLALKVPTTIIEESNTMLKEKSDIELNNAIEKQVNKLNVLIDNMNAMNIIQSNNDNSEVFNVDESIRPLVVQYEDLFKEKNIPFELDIDKNLDLKFDKYLFNYMVKEIIDNGYKYSSNSFKLRVVKEESRILIESINDIDLKDGDQSRVFERFYRLDNDKTKEVEGNGLGLSIVNEIIKKQNGRAKAYVKNKEFILKLEI